MGFPSYRRHTKGQARVTLAGRDFLLGPYGSKESKAKYHRLISEYIASGKSKSFKVEPTSLSVSEVLVAYLAHAKEIYGVSKRGEYYQIKLAMRPVRQLYGSLLASEFGSTEWKTVRKYIVDGKNGNPKAPLRLPSRRYVNGVMQRVTRIFTWAAGDGHLIPAGLVGEIERIKALEMGRTSARETESVEAVSDAVVEATIPFLPKTLQDMVKAQRLMGCRPGELCSLTPSMFDLVGQVWSIVLKRHKTARKGKSRIIAVGLRAQEILKPYLRDRGADECLFRPKDSEKTRREEQHKNRKTPMNCGNKPGSNRSRNPKNKPGDCYTTQTYSKAIGRACKAGGIEHWSPNQLRHAAATQVREAMGIEAAAAHLGHFDLTTTQIYAKQSDELRRQVALRLG